MSYVMYLQCWVRSSKENSQSQHEQAHTHPQTHIEYLYSAVNPFWRGKHEITVEALDRKQRNVWGWLTKIKTKRRPGGSTHTLFYHQQLKPLPASIRPDYTPSTGRLPSRHENTPVNHAQDPKLSQACITEHKSTWRKGRGFTAHFYSYVCTPSGPTLCPALELRGVKINFILSQWSFFIFYIHSPR